MALIKNILVGLALFTIVSCNQNSDRAAVLSKEDKATQIPQVEVIYPKVNSFTESQTITGSLKADKAVMLHAIEQGVVRSISVEIGDFVKKGQTIASLSNPILNFELKEAEVKVLQAQAELKGGQATLKLSETDYQSKLNIYDRIMKVYNESKGLTTLTELDNLKRNVDVAMAQAEVSKARIEQYRAQVNAANAMVSAVNERVGMLKVRAPFSGIITGRFVDQGAMVQSALTNNDAMPIVSIESNNTLRLSLPIPESAMSGIKKGDEVSIDFPSNPTENTVAKISRIARNLDAGSKTMEVQVDLINKSGGLQSGMYAKAKIQRTSAGDKLSLPHGAVLMRKDAASILVIKDGIVEEIKLKKGISGMDYFEVLNTNVTDQTQVIIKGKSNVNAGQPVKAVFKK